MAQDLSVQRNENPAKVAQSRDRPTVAVLIPCYNEELTISTVVSQFRNELPDALIYVFDNNSTDATAEKARQVGAAVFQERRQGKGYAIQSMFRRIDADVYVMVDGDETYPAELVNELMAPILNDEADMVVGSRFHVKSGGAFKRANKVGNKLVLFVLNAIFKVHLTDILSGYRTFNRRFVKGFRFSAAGLKLRPNLPSKLSSEAIDFRKWR